MKTYDKAHEVAAWKARKAAPQWRSTRGWPLLDAGHGRRVSLTGAVYATWADGSLRRLRLDAANENTDANVGRDS